MAERPSRRRFDYDRSLLVNPLLAEREAGVTSLDEAIERTGLTVGYPAWNLLYYTLLCSLSRTDPVVVETGTNLGFSTIVLAQALEDAGVSTRVRSVDVDARAVERARGHLDQAGLGHRVELHVGDSLEFLRRLAGEVDRIDFAFLDSAHAAPHVIAEFEIVHPLVVAAPGTVFFDNTSTGGVAEALARVREKYGGNLVEFANCSWSPPGNAVWQP